MRGNRSLIQLLLVLASRMEESGGPKDSVAALRLFAENRADRLRAAMRQRIYDLMWDGDSLGADAIAEFIPSSDADEAFAAWEHDIEGKQPLTAYYGRGE